MKHSEVQSKILSLQNEYNQLASQAVNINNVPSDSSLAGSLMGMASAVSSIISGLAIQSLANKISELQNFQALHPITEGQDRELTPTEHLQFLYLTYDSGSFKQLPPNLQTVTNFLIYSGAPSQESINEDHKQALKQLLALTPQLQTQAVFETYIYHAAKTTWITLAINSIPEIEKTEALLLHYCKLPENNLRGIIAHSQLSPLLRADIEREELGKKTEANADFLAKTEAFVTLPHFLQTRENYEKAFNNPGLSAKHISNIKQFLEFMPIFNSQPQETELLDAYHTLYQKVFDLLSQSIEENVLQITNLWIKLKKDLRQSVENLKDFLQLETTGVELLYHAGHDLNQYQFDKIIIADNLHRSEAATQTLPINSYGKNIQTSLVGLKEHIATIEGSERLNKAAAVAGIIKEISKEFVIQMTAPQPNLRNFTLKAKELSEKPENKKIIDEHATAFSTLLRFLLEGLQYLFFGYGFYSNSQRGGAMQTTTAAKFHQLNELAEGALKINVSCPSC